MITTDKNHSSQRDTTVWTQIGTVLRATLLICCGMVGGVIFLCSAGWIIFSVLANVAESIGGKTADFLDSADLFILLVVIATGGAIWGGLRVGKYLRTVGASSNNYEAPFVEENRKGTETCPNCGAVKYGRFCSKCGQNDQVIPYS